MSRTGPLNFQQHLQTFLTTSLRELLGTISASDIESHVLDLFKNVVQDIPAYRDFLRKLDIDSNTILSLQDFQQLPLTTKENYIRQYSLGDRCRQGQLQSCDMIAVSSGSTGEPTIWPRSVVDELEIAYRFEQIFKDSFRADERKTLAVICFALGSWVGGLYTLNCCRHLAMKGYLITTVAPGNQPTEIFRVLKALAPEFEQVVLLGYPPFLKNIIDLGMTQGIPWADYQMKFVMAGEVFSEAWRSLMAERVGSTQPCFDFASLYGTADAGVLGNETPLSITIRQWFADHPDLIPKFFGESRLPTLVQYDPRSRFFEVTRERTLLFSGWNGVPLIRYHIADSGGLLPYEALMNRLNHYGFDPIPSLSQQQGHEPYPLPFVYVFGRSHFAVSYFGANLYPENVMVALEQHPVCDWATGKFVMEVREDAEANRQLSIVVELAPQTEGSTEMEETIAIAIQRTLVQLNSEFANYVPVEHQRPQIQLRPTQDAEYFPIGVKHRYTR